MFIFTNLFFRAFVGMFGLVIGIAFVSGIKLGQNALLGSITIMICDASCIILVLSFCPQSRFDIGIWNWIIGGIILAIAVLICVPALPIDWRTVPTSKMVLKRTGIYGIVRNPIYLADILFTLGFALMFRSIISMALIPRWWTAYLAIVLVEEASLERALGQRYLDYKQKVKGRIITGLPI